MGTATDDPFSLLAKEWLVTNGIGGYASSSLLGVATRRYHGLFVPDLPGRGRTLLIPRLDETVDQGTGMALLSGAEYADGRIEMDGIRYLKDIRWEWQTPIWMFDMGHAVLEKRIIAPYGQNTIYIQYTSLSGSMRLHLRPYLTYRMHDARLGEGDAADSFTMLINNGRYEIMLPEGVPTLKLCVRPRGGVFVADEATSEGVSYRVDRDRGSEHIQDLFSPGYFTVDPIGPVGWSMRRAGRQCRALGPAQFRFERHRAGGATSSRTSGVPCPGAPAGRLE
jgi:predicted glycogen debranching enzyme